MSTNPIQIVPKVWSDVPTPPRRELLWLKGGKVCHWCGCPTRLCKEPVSDQATIEHIVPRSRGGTDHEDNLASACFLCNQRRAYEDACGLPDGKLLGKYPITPGQKRQFGIPVPINTQVKPNFYRRVVLTGDEKKAIVNKKYAEDTLREQRDQGIKEIGRLRTEVTDLKSQVGHLKHKLETMTVRKLIAVRIVKWLMRS